MYGPIFVALVGAARVGVKFPHVLARFDDGRRVRDFEVFVHDSLQTRDSAFDREELLRCIQCEWAGIISVPYYRILLFQSLNPIRK